MEHVDDEEAPSLLEKQQTTGLGRSSNTSTVSDTQLLFNKYLLHEGMDRYVDGWMDGSSMGVWIDEWINTLL